MKYLYVKYLYTAVLTLVVASISTLGVAKPLTLDETLEATCRVEVQNARGSGTVMYKSNDKYYILTNAHVVGNARNAHISFFNYGVKSDPVPAKVVWRKMGQGIDFAIVTVDVSSLGNYKPRIIPMVPPNYKVTSNQYISSAGCPRGAWAVAWEGHALNSNNGRVLFQPPPVGGQSGSGIHILWKDKSGELHTRLAAVLTWRIGDEGGAIPVSTLYNILQGKAY